MGRSKATFKQSDVTRAIKGALSAKMEPKRVDIFPDGRIAVLFTDDEDSDAERALDDWMNKHERQA